MELNEEIDSTQDADKLKKILKSVHKQIHRFLINIEESFLRKDLFSAKQLLNKMNYLGRAKQLLDRKLGFFNNL